MGILETKLPAPQVLLRQLLCQGTFQTLSILLSLPLEGKQGEGLFSFHRWPKAQREVKQRPPSAPSPELQPQPLLLT